MTNGYYGMFITPTLRYFNKNVHFNKKIHTDNNIIRLTCYFTYKLLNIFIKILYLN